MSKSRIIGAGSAGSTIYHCNVNLDTAGGTKKQGLPYLLTGQTYNKRWIGVKAVGNKRDTIFTMNQLNGVGHVKWYSEDGLHNRTPYKYVPPPLPKQSNKPSIPPSKHLGRYWSGRPINLNYKGQRPTTLS
jgi:hypothetical protein